MGHSILREACRSQRHPVFVCITFRRKKIFFSKIFFSKTKNFRKILWVIPYSEKHVEANDTQFTSVSHFGAKKFFFQKFCFQKLKISARFYGSFHTQRSM